MSVMITEQGYLFIVTIMCGMTIGLFYDLIRVFRRVISHNNFAINIEDALFWIVCSTIFFIILFNQNNGRLRGFVILGVVIGMSFYFILISYFVVKYISKAIILLLNILKKIIFFLGKPIYKIIKYFKIRIRTICKKTNKRKKNIWKNLHNNMKRIKILVSKK